MQTITKGFQLNLVCVIILLLSCCKKNDIKLPTANAFITVLNISSQISDTQTINDKIFKIDKDENSILKYYYMKVNAGDNNVQLLKKHSISKVILDTNLFFLKDNYYTLIIYDSATAVKTVLIKDSLPKLSRKVWWRFINLENSPTRFHFKNVVDGFLFQEIDTVIPRNVDNPMLNYIPATSSWYFLHEAFSDSSSTSATYIINGIASSYMKTLVYYKNKFYSMQNYILED